MTTIIFSVDYIQYFVWLVISVVIYHFIIQYYSNVMLEVE